MTPKTPLLLPILHPDTVFGHARYAPHEQSLTVVSQTPLSLEIELISSFGEVQIVLDQIHKARLLLVSTDGGGLSVSQDVLNGDTLELPSGLYQVSAEAPDSAREDAPTIPLEVQSGRSRKLEIRFPLVEVLRNKYVRVPAGPVVVGVLLQELEMDEFFIGKYEVSLADYREFVDSTGHPNLLSGDRWIEEFHFVAGIDPAGSVFVHHG